MPDTDEIERTILAMVATRGAGKTICPSEAARALGGQKPDEWDRLMKPIRAAAVRLAKQGQITILRKGRAVDPDDFRGVYRLGVASGEGSGPGNSDPV